MPYKQAKKLVETQRTWRIAMTLYSQHKACHVQSTQQYNITTQYNNWQKEGSPAQLQQEMPQSWPGLAQS